MRKETTLNQYMRNYALMYYTTASYYYFYLHQCITANGGTCAWRVIMNNYALGTYNNWFKNGWAFIAGGIDNVGHVMFFSVYQRYNGVS